MPILPPHMVDSLLNDGHITPETHQKLTGGGYNPYSELFQPALETVGFASPAQAQEAPQIPLGNKPLVTDLPKQVDPMQVNTMTNQLTGDFGGIMTGINQQKAANTAAGKLENEQFQKEADYQQQLFDQAEQMRDTEIAREQARQEKLDQQMSVVNDKLDQFSRSPATIAQSFANASTGNKILAGIALFLGSAPDGQAQNLAVKTMQAAIDSDLEKQKAGIQGERGIYHDMLSTLGDERQADVASRLAYLNNAQIKLNQIATQYKGPLAQENRKIANGLLEQQKGMLNAQLHQLLSTSSSVSNADELTRNIMTKIPKEHQGKAFEEKEIFDQNQRNKKVIDQMYEDTRGIGIIGGNFPKSDKKTELANINASITSQVMDASRGRFTETYIKKMVSPFLVEPSDSQSEITKKKEGLQKFLKLNQKPTQILSGFRVLPPTVEEQKKNLQFVSVKK